MNHPVTLIGKTRIAIIPARGGSKRIPKKNIKLFHGVPMLEICIEKLNQANIFDRIIVSTDSEEIADLANGAGAEVPFLRSNKLSDDYSDTRSVIIDAIDKVEKKNVNIGLVACVYPCIPLISVNVIKEFILAENNRRICLPSHIISLSILKHFILKAW